MFVLFLANYVTKQLVDYSGNHNFKDRSQSILQAQTPPNKIQAYLHMSGTQGRYIKQPLLEPIYQQDSQ